MNLSLKCIHLSPTCQAPLAIRDKETSLFCVPDGFDYHRPVKMGENIILGSTSSLALIKVAGVCLTMSPHGGT